MSDHKHKTRLHYEILQDLVVKFTLFSTKGKVQITLKYHPRSRSENIDAKQSNKGTIKTQNPKEIRRNK